MDAKEYIYSVLSGIPGLRVLWAAALPSDGVSFEDPLAVVSMTGSENYVDLSGPVPLRKTFSIDFHALTPERNKELVDAFLVRLRAESRLSTWDHILDAYDEDLNAHRSRIVVILLEE